MSTWPQWETPNNDELLQLARVLLPHVKIISRSIVELVVAENEKKRAEWTSVFAELDIRPDIYLWAGSPVTFPGIRRHVGGQEIQAFRDNRKEATGNRALALDDNTYPKKLWSFALRNKNTNNTNPPNYALAHVVDHKDYNPRHDEELLGFEQSADKNLFAGLYTSCVNTIWTPTLLMKPTDHRGPLRRLIIQMIDHYYRDVCVILPHSLTFNLENISPEWQLDNFSPPREVGDIDYARNFIAHRNSSIDDLIRRHRDAKKLLSHSG